MSTEQGASCLDGTPPILFIDEGSGDNADKFLLYLDGGGSCVESTLEKSFESCFNRSFTTDGTSKYYEDTLDLNINGYLSPLKEVNPVFHDWTKVLFQYCDGFFSLSQRSDPINVNGKDLYFRGVNNIMASFKYLEETYDFYNKDTIVLSGASAGAMSTVYWVEYLADKTISSKVYAISDSGFFPT